MNNGDKTAIFLHATDEKVRAAILANIAGNYGITEAEALDEITEPDAEHLLDYVTADMRQAVSVLMRRNLGFN